MDVNTSVSVVSNGFTNTTTLCMFVTIGVVCLMD